MKSELQQKILNKYPEFFTKDYKIYTGEKPIAEEIQELLDQEKIIVPIQFGIETGNGWFWLLNNLLDTIQSYIKNNNKPNISITQIKEKFGGLNVYYTGGDELIDGMVWFAEHLSYSICEFCGTNVGVGRTSGWIYTICWDCLQKNERAKDLKWKHINED